MVSADSLIQALRSAGMRITGPRRAICAVLADEPTGHLSAFEVHSRAEKVLGGFFDLSTVYRTIDALQEAGVVHHVHLGQEASVVHLNAGEHHHHLFCEVCGRTVDLPITDLAPLTEILEKHGYLPDTVHFAIVSRCRHH